jgi:hypothetical protein
MYPDGEPLAAITATNREIHNIGLAKAALFVVLEKYFAAKGALHIRDVSVPYFLGPGGHPNSPTCGHLKLLHP